MNKKVHFFNMIEILLALTVIAIGMTSVLGLFPVGLNASRNAIAQNVSADVAEQMITYLRVTSEISSAQYIANFQASTGFKDTALSDAKIKTQSDAFFLLYSQGTIDANGVLSKSGVTEKFKRVAAGWAIFKPDTTDNDLKQSVFFIVQGPNCTENTGAHPADYSAMALVRKSTVQIKRYDGSAWTLWPDFSIEPYLSSPYLISGKLNIELSWPLSLPYSERKKRYYQVVITKP